MSGKIFGLLLTLSAAAVLVLFFELFYFSPRSTPQQEQAQLAAQPPLKTTEQSDKAFTSEVAGLAHKIKLLIDTGFKRAFVERDTRRIYLNLSAIKADPTLAKQDKAWHTIAVHVRYRSGFEPKSYGMTPCLEHKSSEPIDPAHAILFDPGFEWTPQQWQARYNSLDKIALQSTHDAATVYFFDLEAEQPIYRLENGENVYGRVLKFDSKKKIPELRRVLRNVFFDVPLASESIVQATPRPRRKRRRVTSKVVTPQTEQVTPDSTSVPPSPPKFNREPRS